jgi:hypothetical protein
VIRRTTRGFKVVSRAGKTLSRNTLTRAQALKRIRQIEYFKAHKGR